MKPGMHRCLIVLTAFCLAPAGTAQARVGDQSAEIRVVDGNGAPVVQARIEVYPESAEIVLTTAPLSSFTANAEGRANVSWPADTLVRFVVTADRHELRAVGLNDIGRPVTIREGHDVLFTLREDGDGVSGRVAWNITPRLRVAIQSDRAGRGALPGLPNNVPMSVTAFANDDSVTQVLQPDTRAATFQMAPSASIAGRVLDQNGQPAAGAIAVAVGGLSYEATADNAGAFKLTRLRAGDYQLEFHFPAHRTEVMNVRVERARTLALPAVSLNASSQVVVRFLDATTGEPVRSPRVIRASDSPVGFTVRDLVRPAAPYVGRDDGSLLITDLPIGLHQLVLDTPPFARLALPPIEVTADAGFMDLGALSVDRGSQLDLTVLHTKDRPASNIPVRLDHGPGLSPLTPAVGTTDERGLVAFGRLGPGKYRVGVGGDERPGGTTPAAQLWFNVDGAANTIEKQVLIGGVNVTVHAYSEGGPIPGTAVAATQADDDPDSAGVRGYVVQTATRMINVPMTRVARGMTNSEGTVVLEDVPVGAVRLTLSIEGRSWSVPVSVADRDMEADLVLPPGVIAVSPTDASTGEPIAARVTWEESSRARSASPVSGDGVTTLIGISEQPGTLSIEGAGYRPFRMQYTGRWEVPAAIPLARTVRTTLRCRVVGIDGMPLPGATIELRDASTLSKRYATADFDGYGEISDVQSGSWRMVVRRAGAVSTVLPDIQLHSGMNDVGAIRLQRGYRIHIRVGGTSSAAEATVYRVRLLDDRDTRVDDGLDDLSPQTVVSGGEASIGLLSPGRYTVELVSQQKTLRATVRISDADIEATAR